MVAILITTVVLLGLLKSVEIATEQNLKTLARDEITHVAEARMNSFRALPFDMISTCSSCPNYRYDYAPETVPSRMRGVNKTYTLSRYTIVSTDKTSVDLAVRVKWTFKNTSSSYEMHTVRSQ
jgi:hypothetical protein